MSKMTFKQFLLEVDASDLELVRQVQDKQDADANAAQAKDQFSKELPPSPKVGDVIQAKSGNYGIQKMSPNGITAKQFNSGKVVTIKHGTKFKQAGKTDSGNTMFRVVT